MRHSRRRFWAEIIILASRETGEVRLSRLGDLDLSQAPSASRTDRPAVARPTGLEAAGAPAPVSFVIYLPAGRMNRHNHIAKLGPGQRPGSTSQHRRPPQQRHHAMGAGSALMPASACLRCRPIRRRVDRSIGSSPCRRTSPSPPSSASTLSNETRRRLHPRFHPGAGPLRLGVKRKSANPTRSPSGAGEN